MQITYQSIAVHQLQRGRYQPRVDFEPSALNELAQSIKSQGLIEPLIVREVVTGSFEIIAGERRWHAAQLAGLHEVPCLVGFYTDEQAATLTLVENIQRESLNVIEEAHAYRRLIYEFQLTQEDIALRIGKSRSHVANLLRLLHLSEAVQTMVRSDVISLGHARMLVGLSPIEQLRLANAVQTKHWSVRQLEAHVRTLKQEVALATLEPLTSPYCDIQSLQSMLSEQVGTPVQIIQDKERGGLLQFKFFDNDTLAGLLERMGLRYDNDEGEP